MGAHRILVIGVGSIGERHLRCFQSTGRAETALCETNASLRETVAARYGVSRVFADLDEALSAGGGFDAAIIATPAPWHVPMATRLAGAGLHLLIEKPLSISLDGVDGLREAAAASGRVAMVGYTFRSHPALQAMREVIREGRFGRAVQAYGLWGHHFPKYRPAYRSTYYTSHATGGGAMQDYLTHLINAGEFLLGPIDRVAADAAHQVLEGVEVEDTAHVLARHGDVLAAYGVNQYQAPYEHGLTVVCERGTIRFEQHESRWRWMTEAGGEWHDEPVDAKERDVTFIRQADAFLDAVEGKSPPLCTLEEGIQTLRVNLAILAAARDGSWQQVRG